MLSLVPRLSISADLNRFAINGKTFRVKFVRVEEVKHFRRLIIGGSSEIKNRSNALPLIADKFFLQGTLRYKNASIYSTCEGIFRAGFCVR